MEFIKGADVSSLLEVERCGGVFRDGGEPMDALEILKNYGFNYVRLRLWNDPYNENGEDYGAGICDLATVLALAQRAKALGMKWLLDIHYSDFWADPGKQTVPKAWQGIKEQELTEVVYQYTRYVLQSCRLAGVLPDMVQTGNELSSGLLWPSGKFGNWDNICRYVSTGIRAVREEAPQTRTIVHLDNGGKNELYREWFDNFFSRGGDCDIIGLSFYPFWHGRMSGLAANMNDIAVRYQKDLIVVEAGMGFTMEDYTARQGGGEWKGMATTQELVEKIEYPMTPEGQCVYVRELMETVRDIPDGRGKGFFWWEPAWLPVPGTGWAKRAGWEYVHEKGPGGNEWANQALFDYDGNALPSLAVIRDF